MITFIAELSQRTSAQILFKHALAGSLWCFSWVGVQGPIRRELACPRPPGGKLVTPGSFEVVAEPRVLLGRTHSRFPSALLLVCLFSECSDRKSWAGREASYCPA